MITNRMIEVMNHLRAKSEESVYNTLIHLVYKDELLSLCQQQKISTNEAWREYYKMMGD